MKKNYLLLDSRAGMLSLECGGEPDMDILYEDWERYVLVSDTADEVCKYANNGEYGENCIVATMEGKILWEWHSTGIWKPE